MLKPALLYTQEITRKFTEHLYTTDYFYYCGYCCGSSLPKIEEKDNKVAFPAAVVLEKGKAPRLVVNYKIGYVDTNLKAYELVEVPTPHGRLIDADALMECRLEPNHYEELKDGYIPDYDLDSAPTIIEAEVSEE